MPKLELPKNYLFTVVLIPLISLIFLGFMTQNSKALDVYNSVVNIPSSYVNIGTPRGMVMLPDGNIWYVDIQNTRLVLMDPATNEIIRTVGRSGSADGEFNGSIWDITRDNDGYLYVLAGNGELYKLDSNGGLIIHTDCAWEPIASALPPNHCDNPRSINYDAFSDSIFVVNTGGGAYASIDKYSKNYTYINSFGSIGAGEGELDRPYSLTTDSAGKIYVADEWNSRIEIFNSDYSFNSEIDSGWTNIGGSTGFVSVKDIAILSDGKIVATNQNASYIEVFDSLGNHLATYDGGSGHRFPQPQIIIRDNSNNLYISCEGASSIFKYSSSGEFISMFTNAYNDIGKFDRPFDVAYDSHGNMFTLDYGGGGARIQKFTNDGNNGVVVVNNGTIGGDSYHLLIGPDDKLYVSDSCSVKVFVEDAPYWSLDYIISGKYQDENISCGSGNGEFREARGMYIFNTKLYVADVNNKNIQIFHLDSNQKYVYESQITHESSINGDGIGGHFQQPETIAIDSLGNIFLADNSCVDKFNPSGIFVKRIGDIGSYQDDISHYSFIVWVGIDTSNNYLYLSDYNNARVVVYDNNGYYQGFIGTRGGGQLQFSVPHGSRYNPITQSMTITDPFNSRVESLSTGYRIMNLIPSANVVIRTHIENESNAMDGLAGQSLSETAWDPLAHNLSNIPARLMFGDYVVADFTVDLSSGDLDWSTVNVQFLPLTSKALVVNLNGTTAPGISNTHSLYVFKYNNQTQVNVCPDASSLADLHPSCTNEFPLSLESPSLFVDGDTPYTATLSSVTIGLKNYWKISGLVGTGAFSNLFETSFQLKDLMTRLQVNEGSDHRIEFGTSYDLTHDTDTITVTFGAEWNLSGLTSGDIGLIAAGFPLTVGSSPAADVWGYGRVGNVITLTAPSSGTQYINGGSTIILTISNGAILNPSTSGSYQIDIAMLNADSEVGSITVPIVDSDQVDVTGYVNAYLNFDIDTSVADTKCNFDECLNHGGGSAANNYTVDLGELTSATVNKSNNGSVAHSDGPGIINSIYFDLTTNASSGAIVKVSSQNGWLQGPGESKLASVTDTNNIAANSGLYGFDLPIVSTPIHGTVVRNTSCDSTGLNEYCGPTMSPKTVFDTNNLPVDTARVRMDIAAAASYTNNPGNYTDTLTFVATGTF